jgi:cysteine sulfinate desulfinase/cysteine desulfurase-like protein
MIEIAHRLGACVLLDGAQSVSHMRTDVSAPDCDFFVFSGHKIFGPTDIGVVYGKADVLQAKPPWQGGGNMIADVTSWSTRPKKCSAFPASSRSARQRRRQESFPSFWTGVGPRMSARSGLTAAAGCAEKLSRSAGRAGVPAIVFADQRRTRFRLTTA